MKVLNAPPLTEATNLHARGWSQSACNLAAHPAVSLAMLIALVWCCFGNTLTSYFLADDFAEIQYVSNIFNGQPALFWSNWTGNYMQVPGMSVYRPWLLVSLMADYCIWGANAFGFYLTNLLAFTACVLALFLVIRELTSDWPKWRRAGTSFFTAALFAVSPLHCESISWVVGRVDIVCCLFYLSSLYFFIRRRSLGGTSCVILGTVCYWLALLTKEMAIGLPVLVTAIGFLWPLGTRSSASLVARLKSAIALSLPLWLSTTAYFVLRYLALGTFVGGYTDGFGASQASVLFAKWTDPDTLSRLAFPFNYHLYQGSSIYSRALSAAYMVLMAIAGMRLLAGELSKKWFLLILVWFITAALPIYQLWGLGFNLDGARFYFFFTLPLSLLLPLLVFQPHKVPQSQSEVPAGDPVGTAPQNLTGRQMIIGTVALIACLSIFFKTANNTNKMWVRAGKEVRAIKNDCERLAASALGNRFVLLGIPDGYGLGYGGTHMILNSTVFETMLKPPFSSGFAAESFFTFEPVLFGPTNRINGSRYEKCLSLPQVKGPYAWSSSDRRFLLSKTSKPQLDTPQMVELKLGPMNPWTAYTRNHIFSELSGKTLRLSSLKDGDGILFPVDVNPAAFDFLEFEIKYSQPYVPACVKARWNCLGAEHKVTPAADAAGHNEAISYLAPSVDDSQFQKVQIRLSHFWSWYTAGNIRELVLELFPAWQIELRNVCLKNEALVAPRLQLVGQPPSLTGSYPLSSAPVTLGFTAPEAKGSFIEIEISKPNFFFDNVRELQSESIVAKRLRFPASNKTAELARALFAKGGYQEIRARWLDSSGYPIGAYSDTLTLQLRS